MSDVVPFERPTPPTEPPHPPKPPTLKDNFGRDAWPLEAVAAWRSVRAQMQRNWAEHELMSGWGWLLEDHVLDKEPLERMLALENQLSFFEPRTILLAREMLRACVTILAHGYEDPESPLAQGPVLEIIRNVLKSLENVKGETPIGEAVFKRRRRKAAAKRKAE